MLKNYLHGKTSYIEKKNYIEKFAHNAKLLVFKTICIENLFGFKN